MATWTFVNRFCRTTIGWSVCWLVWVCLQAQTAPPTLQKVDPKGGQSGSRLEVVIEGINLLPVTRLHFNHSGITGSVVHEEEFPIPPPMRREGVVVTSAIIQDISMGGRLRVLLEVSQEVEPGVYAFRVETPRGLTNSLPFAVAPFQEIVESVGHQKLEEALKVSLPVTVAGRLTEVGQTDYYRFEGRPGQTVVFSMLAPELGSRLNAGIDLIGPSGKIVAQTRPGLGRELVLGHRLEQVGEYVVAVSDWQIAAGENYFYRLMMGEFGYITGVFPLGLPENAGGWVQLQGFNLEAGESLRVEAEQLGKARRRDPRRLRPQGVLNSIRLAVGSYPEALEAEPNGTLETAQIVTIPVTINGRISGVDSSGAADEDFFRFTARKGQRLVLEVEAEGLGSSLDSILEILDGTGKPMPRARVRCLAKTEVTLRDHDSIRTGMRLLNWDDLAVNDYVMVGAEILQVNALPRHPDDDLQFKGLQGRRVTYFDTTSQAHALGSPVFKVRVAPPDTEFPPNGLPVIDLHYLNDDGGMFFGKDSRLLFEVPEDGSYVVRLRDARGLEGEHFGYRLTLREVQPDFRLLTSREVLNVPAGGRIPVTISAYRIDGFEEPIKVRIEGLPDGYTAEPALIPSDADSTVILVSASGEASGRRAVPFTIVGEAYDQRRKIIRKIELTERIGLAFTSANPEIRMAASPRVEVLPGEEVTVTVSIERQGEFKGRVPLDVRNLPHGVRVLDVGLNGVLITEEEDARTYVLFAEPWVRPGTYRFYTVGRVETTSPIAVEESSEAVELVILPERAGF